MDPIGDILDIKLTGGGTTPPPSGGTDVWDGTVDTSWYDASRSSFTLYTGGQLAGLAKLVNDGNDFYGRTVTLAANLNLAGRQWTPIGSYNNNYPFRGTFDGGGHTVSGMTSVVEETEGDAFAGLFGYIDTGGTVKGVHLSGVYVSSSASSYSYYSSYSAYAGGIAGVNSGTIENCESSGTVSASASSSSSSYAAHSSAGGIAGWNYGTIENCESSGTVSSSSSFYHTYAGGIAGWNGGTIENCESSGTVSSSSSSYYYFAYAGGIAGINDGTIENCESSGTVSASASSSSSSAGGIAGINNGNIGNSTSRVSEVTSVATGVGGAYRGGFVGYFYGGTFSGVNRTEGGVSPAIGYDRRLNPPGPSDNI
jgi:hypothetical protein